MEQHVKFTDGKINLHGNFVHREKPKFADYVLYANKATPIAVYRLKTPITLFRMGCNRLWNMLNA